MAFIYFFGVFKTRLEYKLVFSLPKKAYIFTNASALEECDTRSIFYAEINRFKFSFISKLVAILRVKMPD